MAPRCRVLWHLDAQSICVTGTWVLSVLALLALLGLAVLVQILTQKAHLDAVPPVADLEAGETDTNDTNEPSSKPGDELLLRYRVWGWGGRGGEVEVQAGGGVSRSEGGELECLSRLSYAIGGCEMLDSNVEADSPLSVTLGAHHLHLLPSTKVQILTPEELQTLTLCHSRRAPPAASS